MTVLDRNSLPSSGFITSQIKGRFAAPQPGDPCIAPGLRVFLAYPRTGH